MRPMEPRASTRTDVPPGSTLRPSGLDASAPRSLATFEWPRAGVADRQRRRAVGRLIRVCGSGLACAGRAGHSCCAALPDGRLLMVDGLTSSRRCLLEGGFDELVGDDLLAEVQQSGKPCCLVGEVGGRHGGDESGCSAEAGDLCFCVVVSGGPGGEVVVDDPGGEVCWVGEVGSKAGGPGVPEQVGGVRPGWQLCGLEGSEAVTKGVVGVCGGPGSGAVAVERDDDAAVVEGAEESGLVVGEGGAAGTDRRQTGWSVRPGVGRCW